MAKKRAAKKKTTDDPKPVPDGQLGDWLDEIPEAVAEAADDYDKAHRSHSRAKAKLDAAKLRVIDKMKETGCKRCPIRNGAKFLRLDEVDRVVIEKRVDDDED